MHTFESVPGTIQYWAISVMFLAQGINNFPLTGCHWFLLLGHVGVAFIERRLSLLILFIIFETQAASCH
jgi:hypothetical protein